jgi:hypothetical protein
VDSIEEQFANQAAFRDGQTGTGEVAGNKEFELPLLLTAASRSALHQLIVDINNDLVRGVEVEFASSDDDDSTHFLLEAGQLDVEYQYFLTGIHATTKALLRLWTQPFGSTGTARVVASLAGSGPQDFPATGILGDVNALANLEIRVGSAIASAGRVAGYGVARSASFLGRYAATGATYVASSTLVGEATSPIGSVRMNVPVNPTAPGLAPVMTKYLTPPNAYVGRHRILVPLRSNFADRSMLKLYAKDQFGAILGPTVTATQNDPARMMIADFGEIQVPARASGQEAVPTQAIYIVGGGASGASYAQASGYGLSVGGLILLPLDISPGLMRTGGGQITGQMTDSFDRLTTGETYLAQSPISDSGHTWTRLQSDLGIGMPPGFPADMTDGKLVPISPTLNVFQANATGAYALASGTLNTVARAEFAVGYVGFGAASAQIASVAYELWAKARTNASTVTDGVCLRLVVGPTHNLSFWTASNSATALIASNTIATTLASGLFLGQEHRLMMLISNAGAFGWIATNPGVGAAASPHIAMASRAEAGLSGWPAVRAIAGSNIGTGVFYLDSFNLDILAGASDIGPREWFRFESYRERRAYQGNASIFLADRTPAFRGQQPQLPPVGSPGASGPARVVAFEGPIDDFRGNDVIALRLDAVERFKFLR